MSRGKRAKKLKDCGHPRLLSREIPEYREKLYEEQGRKCVLCNRTIEQGKAVLDHCHSSGLVRGTLHRGCNVLLAKLENNYKRVGVTEDQFSGFAPKVHEYINADYSNRPFHPDHRTSEEKRLSRNERARDKRATKKQPARRKVKRG